MEFLIKNNPIYENNQATKEDIDYYSKLKEKYYRQFCKEDQATFHLVEGSYDYFKQLKDQKFLLQ